MVWEQWLDNLDDYTHDKLEKRFRTGEEHTYIY